MSNVLAIRQNNYNGLLELGFSTWIEWMISSLYLSNNRFFRYHSSGDVFCIEYLLAIIEVANKLPNINFWLPTHNHKLIQKINPQEIPNNLTISLSCIRGSKRHQTLKPIVKKYKRKGVKISFAFMHPTNANKKPKGHICVYSGKSKHKLSSCQTAKCRHCWLNDRDVTFLEH